LTPPIDPAQETAPVTSCTDNQTSDGYFQKHETIDQAYVTAVRTVVKGQLAEAGGRLAAVLYGTLK
jgi:hypothetical protein